MRRYLKLDLSALKEHFDALAEARLERYEIDEKAIREVIADTLCMQGTYYMPLHVLTKGNRERYAVIPALDYIPLGKFTDRIPYKNGERGTWEISVGATPGAQMFSGLESNKYQLHFKLVEKQNW